MSIERTAGAHRDAIDEGRPIVMFSDDWAVHPSSSQHIFKQIIGSREVIWVNTVGMRRPTLSRTDFVKAVRKLSGMLSSDKSASSAETGQLFHLLKPPMIPFNNIGWVRRINRFLVARSLRKAVKRLGGELPLIVTTVPNACDYVDLVPGWRVIYYCVDDFSEWPGLDRTLLLEMEQKLVRKTDIFIATSSNLHRKLAMTGKPTELLPHGVDIDLFSSDASEEHACLERIPAPRAGYFGLFDERSDQRLIAEVAHRVPDISIVIAGNVVTDVRELAAVGNVHFVGPLPYEELPKFIKGMRTLFIPYVVNALSDALSPLKFKEYLATGRTVISTPIAAANELSELIEVESDPARWASAILDSGNGRDEDRAERIRQFLDGESWAEKAARFLAICER